MTCHRMLLLALAILPLSGLPVFVPAFTTAQAQDYLPPQNLEAPRSILPPRLSNSQASSSSSASSASSGSSSAAYTPSPSSGSSSAAYAPSASSGSSSAAYTPSASPGSSSTGYAPSASSGSSSAAYAPSASSGSSSAAYAPSASSGSSNAAYAPSPSSGSSNAAYAPSASSGSSSAAYAPPSNDNPGYGQPYSAPATAAIATAAPSDSAPPPPAREWGPPVSQPSSYSTSEILDAGRSFFGGASQGLAKVVEYSFQKNGRPNGYILGEEGSGAIVAGLRYGEGMLYQKGFPPQKVYWQGPSLGYDFGANGSKSFTLVYNLQFPSQIYERFAGIDGSAYLVGGVGITFQQHDDVILAPIRAGVGLRLGANVGYLKYTAAPTWNPF